MNKSTLIVIGLLCIGGAAWIYITNEAKKNKACSCNDTEEKNYNYIDDSKLDEILL